MSALVAVAALLVVAALGLWLDRPIHPDPPERVSPKAMRSLLDREVTEP